MRIFISGGCKNGKSGHAQALAKAMGASGRPLYYVATMQPVDEEDDARIVRHREERAGWGFTTVEQPSAIHAIANRCDIGGCFLIDSATALLSNEMFPPGGAIDLAAADRLCRDFAALLPLTPDVVVVSDYIYTDAALYDDLTEAYRRGLAQVDRTLAGLCEVVAEAAFGSLIFHKGRALFEKTMEVKPL